MRDTTLREKEVHLSHGRTRYFGGGDGAAVILLHGVGFLPAAVSWLPTAELLEAAGFEVFAPDFVGWGPGDGLEQPYSFAYLVDFVREFQDALDLRSSIIVGHSMGGWVSSIFAYESPDRVDSLVLVASGGMATRPLKSMVEWQPPTETEIVDEFDFLVEAGIDPTPYLDEARVRSADPTKVAQYRRVKDHMSVPETRARFHTARRLSRTPIRTLILWGDEDEVNPYELGQETAQVLPDGHLVTGEGLGHFLPQHHPGFLSSNIARFCGRDDALQRPQ